MGFALRFSFQPMPASNESTMELNTRCKEVVCVTCGHGVPTRDVKGLQCCPTCGARVESFQVEEARREAAGAVDEEVLAIRAARKLLDGTLVNWPGVVSVGTALRQRGSEEQDSLAITVSIDRKRRSAWVPESVMLPAEVLVNGRTVPLDVREERGSISPTATMIAKAGNDIADEPVWPGPGAGPPGDSGTLGCIVGANPAGFLPSRLPIPPPIRPPVQRLSTIRGGTTIELEPVALTCCHVLMLEFLLGHPPGSVQLRQFIASTGAVGTQVKTIRKTILSYDHRNKARGVLGSYISLPKLNLVGSTFQHFLDAGVVYLDWYPWNRVAFSPWLRLPGGGRVMPSGLHTVRESDLRPPKTVFYKDSPFVNDKPSPKTLVASTVALKMGQRDAKGNPRGPAVQSAPGTTYGFVSDANEWWTAETSPAGGDAQCGGESGAAVYDAQGKLAGLAWAGGGGGACHSHAVCNSMTEVFSYFNLQTLPPDPVRFPERHSVLPEYEAGYVRPR